MGEHKLNATAQIAAKVDIQTALLNLSVAMVELQREVMEQGKALGQYMDILKRIDFGAGSRLKALEEKVGIVNANSQPEPKPEEPTEGVDAINKQGTENLS